MNQLKTLSLTAVLLATAFAGCAPAPPAPAQAPVPPAAPPAPVAKKAEPAKPAAPAPPAKPAEPVVLVPAGENFVYNASFETWKGGEAGAWNLAEGFEDKWEPVKAQELTAAAHGESAIALPAPAEGKTVILSQTIMPGKVVPERRLFVSAQVNSQEKESLHLVLTYNVDGKTETIRRVSQGDAGWAKLEAQFWVPKNVDPASFRIQFIVQKGVKNPVQLDDVRIQMMYPKGSEPKPAPAPKPAAAKAEEAPKAEEKKADEKKEEPKPAAEESKKSNGKSTKSDAKTEKSDTKKKTSN